MLFYSFICFCEIAYVFEEVWHLKIARNGLEVAQFFEGKHNIGYLRDEWFVYASCGFPQTFLLVICLAGNSVLPDNLPVAPDDVMSVGMKIVRLVTAGLQLLRLGGAQLDISLPIFQESKSR